MDFLPPWLALSTAWSPTTDGECELKSRATYLMWVGLRKMAEDASCEHGISPVVVEARFGTAPASPLGSRPKTTRATNLPAVLRDLKEVQESADVCAKDALRAAGDSAPAAARGRRLPRPLQVGDCVMDSAPNSPSMQRIVLLTVSGTPHGCHESDFGDFGERGVHRPVGCRTR